MPLLVPHSFEGTPEAEGSLVLDAFVDPLCQMSVRLLSLHPDHHLVVARSLSWFDVGLCLDLGSTRVMFGNGSSPRVGD